VCGDGDQNTRNEIQTDKTTRYFRDTSFLHTFRHTHLIIFWMCTYELILRVGKVASFIKTKVNGTSALV